MTRGSLTVGELAAEFPDLVTSGISKHLMTLRAAGLAQAVKSGRHQHYQIDDEGLRTAFAPWITQYETYWANALNKLQELSVDESNDGPSGPGGARRV